MHPEALVEGLSGITVAYSDACDVLFLVAKAVHESSESPRPWAEVEADAKELGDKVNRAKKRLNRDAAARMTYERLAERDTVGEVEGWLRRINAMLA